VARAPFRVCVYPYIKAGDSDFEYALLQSHALGFWQGAAGGGEGNETPLEAARREAYEETGIHIVESSLIQLDTVASVPVTESRSRRLWGETVYVIPQYYFGVLADNRQILLSEEHIEYRWLTYQDAFNLLKYDSDSIALWELDRRLRRLGPKEADLTPWHLLGRRKGREE
jgi:dATP pyrophosphohydrolase